MLPREKIPARNISNAKFPGASLKIAFRDKPLDLVAIFVVVALSVALTSPGSPEIPRFLAGLLFVFFAPGYMLLTALFPRNEDMSWYERVVLSFGLSVATVALVGIGLNFTPWGILTAPVLGSLLGLTTSVGILAWWRRIKLPTERRIAFSVVLQIPGWASLPSGNKLAIITFALALLFSIGTLGYVVLTPRPAERFTDFYILNATSVAGGYPTNLTINETGTIRLIVHNVEYADLAYEIRVHRATMAAFFNASANQTQYRELSRTYVTNFSLDLPNGGYWNRSYNFSNPSAGIYRIYFDLYKLPDTQKVYRHLFLTVFVRR